MTLPNCPKCDAEYTYQEGHLYICPMCFNEWIEESQKAAEEALKRCNYDFTKTI